MTSKKRSARTSKKRSGENKSPTSSNTCASKNVSPHRKKSGSRTNFVDSSCASTSNSVSTSSISSNSSSRINNNSIIQNEQHELRRSSRVKHKPDYEHKVETLGEKRDREALEHMEKRQNYSCTPWDLDVISTTDRGRGLQTSASCTILHGSYVCEYKGELITGNEAAEREVKYEKTDPNADCFMFYFKHNGKPMCIDATEGKTQYGLGRLINHSKHHANLSPRKIIDSSGHPHIAFFACRQIDPHTELLFNYNDTRPEALQSFPWLKA
eukprot:TRINITY_DN2571_c0_g1_i1.p1 TRINITY_DN2571_c0_g1~~TRINITY_DN2571_c0_g1_i1.p1  ORF type:complete len:269 (+),score=33.04 TRINITY_DN2571_c0_g1_i1:16-822(+)